MKCLMLLFTLMLNASYSLYMGNPAEPQIMDKGIWIPQECIFGLKVGYQGDRVANRKMRASSHAHGRMDTMELSFDQAVLTLNFLDRLEFYGSVGAMNGALSHRPRSDHKRRQYQTHDGWSAGTGGRFLLAQWKNLVIGIDGKIQWSHPGIKWMDVSGVSKDAGGHLKYMEWQTSFAVSYTVDWLTPYLGIKYSNARASVSGIPSQIYPYSSFKMVNPSRFGGAIGCTLSPGKKIDLFAEVQIIDEQGLAFGGNLKF